MCTRKDIFPPALLILLSLVLTSGCSSQASPPTSLPPTASPIPSTATPNPTETSTPKPSPTPMLNPVAQGYHQMAYDIESDRIVLVAGSDNQCNSPKIATSIFDLPTQSWELIETDSSVPKGEGPMAYDAQSDRIIKFVGLRQSCTIFDGLGETWAYDTNTNTWENMHPSESPFGLIGARMVYDSESDRMILFGGLDATSFAGVRDTWAYDYETNTWKNLQPAGTLPWGYNFFAMSYDMAADRIIAWGCDTGTIWVYDYNSNTWESRETETYPAYCDYNAMVYHPGTGLHILFGGTKRSDESPTNETWGYDYSANSWKSLSVKNPPSARGWHAMVFDSAAGVMVLFGGGESRDKFTDETWIYNPTSGEWSNVTVSP